MRVKLWNVNEKKVVDVWCCGVVVLWCVGVWVELFCFFRNGNSKS